MYGNANRVVSDGVVSQVVINEGLGGNPIVYAGTKIEVPVDAGGEVINPTFKVWKGELAQNMLDTMWRVSGGDKAFVLTMLAENGTYDPYRKHPNRNRDGSWDFSFGLNSYYHSAMIQKIVNKQASLEEIAAYHLSIYNKPDYTTSCGKKAFCGYNKIKLAKIKNQIIFPNS